VNELDGNAMAGELREIFAVDVTSAMVTCAGCGNEDAVATLRVWMRSAGQVARCRKCDSVVLRVVRAPGRIFLEMRGAMRLEVPLT